ncbi:hypothetical protein Taro_048404, partial [Colocasia esculenta]|nr:hypothetical protein [Colocasia esculenta]
MVRVEREERWRVLVKGEDRQMKEEGWGSAIIWGAFPVGEKLQRWDDDVEKDKGGPVSYKELFEHTHRRKNIGDFVSQKEKEVMETYAEQMVDRHGSDSTQHPEFDAMAWLAAIVQPKKGRVFEFGSGLDADRVISSSQDSHGSTITTTPPHSSTLPSDQVCEVIFDVLNNLLTHTLVPTLQTMGVGLRSPASVASSGASDVSPIRDPIIEAHQVAERDDDEDEDL